MEVRGMLLSLMVAIIGHPLLLPTLAFADSVPRTGPTAEQHPLVVIEQHRASVVQRIVGDWNEALAALPKERALTPKQLSEALWTLRADRLLAASLAGSFATIESILADDMADRAPVQRAAAKSLGNANADLTYTPINPCRIADTRNVGGTLAANTPRTFDGFSANFSTQGGTATNCGMPNGVAAIAMNVYAVNPTNLGFIKVYPANGAEPAVSTVNYQTGIVAVATGAIVPVDSANNNRFIAKSPAQVDFIADVVGYFRAPGGNIVLPESASASAGNIMKGSNSFIHNFGAANTFVGEIAGNFTMTGGDNAAFGYGVLAANTTGASNTAMGVEALFNNTTGTANTAIGDAAAIYNTLGSHNTAVGYTALYSHDHGDGNTAVGDGALFSDLTGSANTGVGFGAMNVNDVGYSNTAVGWGALGSNTSGCCNTAIGVSALPQNTSGNGNVAIGELAGKDVVTGNGNIYINSFGLDGESYTIRIGQTSPARAFIAGIRGVMTGVANAIPVYIDSNWQLGTASSSRRVKDDIADMGEQSSLLMQLRPVTFYYKSDHDPSGRTLQYGLVAEEVEKIAPGLVARTASGEVETVFYQFLPPMLLNEYQKQQRAIEAQAARIETQARQTAALERTVDARNAEVATLQGELAELRRAVEMLMARTPPEGRIAQAH